MLSGKGDKIIIPLCDNSSKGSVNGYDQSLLVSSCGPITQIGQRSIAVGFGNIVKVITVGQERFEQANESFEDSALPMAGRRRKAQGSGKRSIGHVP